MPAPASGSYREARTLAMLGPVDRGWPKTVSRNRQSLAIADEEKSVMSHFIPSKRRLAARSSSVPR
jgi:hypothetical protein